MNISTVALILVAAWSLGLLLLVVGGLLVRSDLHRATLPSSGAVFPPLRLLDDLRPVQDLVVDFVAESKPSSRLLDFLGEQTKPISIIELRANLPFRAEEVWTAIFITSVAGLIRVGRDGITVTDAGRVVRGRLNDSAVRETEPAARLQLEPSNARRTTSASDSFQHGQPPAIPTERRVSVSAADHHELSAAIAASRKLAVLSRETRPLQDKLMRATITPASDVPHDLITMNSRAELVDLHTKERVDLGVVYPAEADIGKGRISVFHPLGAAMFGRRVGDEFEWTVPYGTRRFKVAAVPFQPEAALAMAV